MALDFSILSRQPSFAESYMAGQQEAQRNALAQQQLQTQQQALAQSKLQMQMTQAQFDQAQKDRAALDNMAKAFAERGHTGTLDENFDKMIASGIPQYVQIGITGKQKLAEQQQFARIMGGGVASPAAAAPAGGPAMTPAPAEPSAVRNALGLAQAAPAAAAPVNALAAPAVTPDSDIAARVRALQDKETALLSLGTPQAIAAANAITNQIKALQAQHVVAPGGALVGPGGQVIYQAQEKQTPTELQRNYEYAQKQGFKGDIFEYERRLKEAGRPPAQPREPAAPVPIYDEQTGKVKYVSREEAMGKTPAAAMEGLSPKEIQKREAALPQATSAIKGFETKSDLFIRDLKALRDDPGLENITGPIFGRTGSVSPAGSRAQALYDKVVAKGGFQALQDLRDASKTGGALGNQSDREGKQLIASFAAIDRRQSAADVRAAIDQAIADIEGSKTRMREAYDATYAYKQGGAVAPTAAPATAAPKTTRREIAPGVFVTERP